MPLNYEGPTINTANPEENGPIRKAFPFHNKFGDADHVVFTQPYMQQWEDYGPPTLNDSATIGGETVYCVGDEGLSDAGAGLVAFDRQWANVPASHFDYETTSVTYPGYTETREPYTQTTQAQIEYEYFLVGPGQTYTTPDEIPLIAETRMTSLDGEDAYLLSGNVYINFAGGGTTPTIEDYQDWVAAETYEIVVDCRVEQYLGNIWSRITRSVQAK